MEDENEDRQTVFVLALKLADGAYETGTVYTDFNDAGRDILTIRGFIDRGRFGAEVKGIECIVVDITEAIDKALEDRRLHDLGRQAWEAERAQ